MANFFFLQPFLTVTVLRFFCYQIIFASLLVTGFAARLQAAPLEKSPQHRLAHGFDFPAARPDAEGYYKSRGFRTGGHLGEDWLSDEGSGHSLGLPVFNIADGVVLLARDVHVAWGNVIVIRHAYFEAKKVQFVDSLYAHLDRIQVKEGDSVSRGQQIGTIGNNHGMYPSHLHFELHKNLNVGVNHTGFAKTLLNYWIPTDFIVKRRNLSGGPRTVFFPVTHFDIPSPWSWNRKAHCPKKNKILRMRTAPKKKSNNGSSSKKINTHFQVNRYTD